jgi:Domain of unknown function (DUF4412)
MKKYCFLLVIISAIQSYSLETSAQDLKNALNDLSQSLQSGAVNKAVDKFGKILENKPNSTDTSSINKVLGSLSKAAEENPNDTSSADLTMKALGILAGGGGVSAKDSAAAIENFKSAGGGSGVFIQYETTVNMKETGTTKDTSTSYLTESGEGRKEMNLAGMMGVKNGASMIMLGRANTPGYLLMLNPAAKTYTLNVIDTSLINSTKKTYVVTKVGNETISAYSCIHSKLKETMGSAIFKSTTEMDIWTSTSVPGYSLLKKVMAIENLTPQMFQALEKAGCGGFIVKLTSNSKDASVDMELIHAENKNFGSGLFRIPDGYTESKNNTIINNLVGSSPK